MFEVFKYEKFKKSIKKAASTRSYVRTYVRFSINLRTFVCMNIVHTIFVFVSKFKVVSFS